jgi:hypothetical protein
MKERRQHRRYSLPRGTFVIVRPKLDALQNHKRMSIGEISMVLYKSKSEMMAQVKNVGQGGIAFDGQLQAGLDHETVEMDLLMAEKGLYLHNLPYSILYSDSESSEGKKNRRIRANAVRFTELDMSQQRQLDEMMSHGTPV